MISPRPKLVLLGAVFLPGALLSLLSPIVILAVPALLERVFSQRPDVWSTGFQYSAPLAPIVGMAVIDGLWRARRWYELRQMRLGLGASPALASAGRARMTPPLGRVFPRGDRIAKVAIALLVVAVVITIQFPVSLLVANKFQLLRPDPSKAAVDAASRLLPNGIFVATSNNLVPPLLNKDKPLVIAPDSVCGSWALVWTGVPEYPYVTTEQLLHQVASMERHGWDVIYGRAHVELLRHRGPGEGGYDCKRDDPLLAPG